MNRVTGFFLEDWRRKLLALGIAILIWSFVEGQIAIEDEVQLTLVVAEGEISTPEEFHLLVQAPEGWILTSPAAGESIPVRFRGSASELTEFRGNQCAASIRVAFTAEPNQDLYEYPLTPEDLDWMRPGDAAFLLQDVQGAQQLQSLTFERLDEQVVVLSFREVPVEGIPSSAHEAQPDEMSFEPSQVTLRGPKFAIEQLQARIEETHAASGELQNAELLRTLRIEGNTRSDIRANLSLHEDLARLGIRMEPALVKVRLPIRLKNPTSIRWLPEASDLIILPADDEASNGPWTPSDWIPTQWVAEMPDVESDTDINLAWIRDHVSLILPMRNLTSASLDQEDLRIEVHLTGLNDREFRFYREHLTIKPVEPESATVKVTRNP